MARAEPCPGGIRERACRACSTARGGLDRGVLRGQRAGLAEQAGGRLEAEPGRLAPGLRRQRHRGIARAVLHHRVLGRQRLQPQEDTRGLFQASAAQRLAGGADLRGQRLGIGVLQVRQGDVAGVVTPRQRQPLRGAGQVAVAQRRAHRLQQQGQGILAAFQGHAVVGLQLQPARVQRQRRFDVAGGQRGAGALAQRVQVGGGGLGPVQPGGHRLDLVARQLQLAGQCDPAPRLVQIPGTDRGVGAQQGGTPDPQQAVAGLAAVVVQGQRGLELLPRAGTLLGAVQPAGGERRVGFGQQPVQPRLRPEAFGQGLSHDEQQRRAHHQRAEQALPVPPPGGGHRRESARAFA